MQTPRIDDGLTAAESQRQVLEWLGLSPWIRHIERAPGLAEEMARLRVPPATTGWSRTRYALRMLYPPSLAHDTGESIDIERAIPILPEIFTVYWYVLRQRLGAEQPFSEDELAVFLLTVRYGRGVMHGFSSDASEVSARVSEHLPASLVKPLRQFDGCGPLDEGKSQRRLSRHIRSLLHRLGGRDEEPTPRYSSRVRGLFVRLSSERDGAGVRVVLKELFAEFFEIRSGLFCTESHRSRGSNRPKYFLSTLVLLGIVNACKVLGIPIESPCMFVARPTPRFGSGSNADSAFDWIRRLRSPPRLPMALAPDCLDLDLHVLESAVRNEIESKLIDRFGFSLHVDPLEADHAFVLSLRHDVDRPLLGSELREILAFEQAAGVRSSWYFKPETFDEALAALLLEQGCEIGYHASHVEHGDGGFALSLRQRYPEHCVGCTFHGGAGSTYWTGRKSAADCVSLGFRYSEMLTEWIAHPYRLSMPDGQIILTPMTIKFDAHREWLDRQMNLVRATAGHAIIETHPDLFSRARCEFIEECLRSGALVRTVREHVDACADTARSEMSIARRAGTDDLEIELRCASPVRARIAIDKRVFSTVSAGSHSPAEPHSTEEREVYRCQCRAGHARIVLRARSDI